MRPATSPSFRAELGATLRLAGPLALANVLQMAVYAIDVIFVARLGQEALAASSLSVSLFGLLMWSFSGLTGAVAPLVAAELGRRTHAVRSVRRSMRMGMWLTLMCAMAAMAIVSFGEQIMLAAGQAPRVAERAGSFLHVLKWAAAPMIACNVLRIFVSALGRPVFATAITAFAILVNALGNYAFVFGRLGAPALGLEGSALASNITAWAMLLAYAIAIRTDRKLRRYRIWSRWWQPEWQRFREIVRIGTPIALTVVAEGGLFGSAAFLMGLIGEAELAGHTIALQVAALAFQVPFGIGQAATIRVGYHFGAADRTGVGRAGWAALLAGMGFMAVSASLMLLFPRPILHLYVDASDPGNAAMAAFAVQFLAIAAAFQLFDGTQTVAAGVLRGLQDTRVPMVIAILGYWLPGFGTAVLLGFRTSLRGLGVWIGLATGLVVVAALLLRRWHRRERLKLVPFRDSREDKKFDARVLDAT
jgi:multidrug resistance protein, MATE family